MVQVLIFGGRRWGNGNDWRYSLKCGGFLPDDAQVGRKRKNFSDVIRKWNGRVALGELHQKTAKQHRWRRRSEATVPSMPRHNIGAGMD